MPSRVRGPMIGDGEPGSALTQLSHDLRTPLNAILGYSELLALTGDNLTLRQREHLRSIHESGAQLLEILCFLLARAEAHARRGAGDPVSRVILAEGCGPD
jgi:signal transduction histidine kinase